MKMIASVAVVIAMAAVVSPLFADDAKPSDKVTIEFRRAESEPAEGLIEHVVPGGRRKVYVHPGPGITNKQIASVRAHRQQIAGASRDILGIAITLTDEGARMMEQMSAKHLRKPIAILIDGKVVMAPILHTRLSRDAVISGNFSEEEVQRIVDAFAKR